MTKLITCLALFCFISINLADDCNNPLLSVFGFTGLAQPTAVTGLKFCKSLQRAGQSCCSAETINTIEEKAKTLGQRLSAIVANRDRAIVETRDRVIPGLERGLKNIKDNSARALERLRGNSGQGGQGGSGSGSGSGSGEQNPRPAPPPPRNRPSTFTSTQATEVAENIGNVAQTVVNNLPGIRAGFKNFQKSRASCVVELLKLQSAAWCLACDPAYATKGVSGENIQLSTRVCRRLQSSCFRFLSESATQSSVLSVRSISTLIDSVATSLQSIANGDSNGLTALATATSTTTTTTSTTPADNAATPVALPPTCTSDTQCDWICSNLFSGAEIQETNVVTGGVPSDATAATTTRLLVEAEEEESVVKGKLQKRRVLTATEFDPDTDESGVTVAFAEDPAGVGGDSTSGAGLIKSGLVCLVGMLVALLF